jgi:sugar-specific transcriptional regulator TrmB
MNQELFESLGLSPNEGKLYETLLERGESSVSDIALAAGIHRRNAYDAMERLMQKGLCFEIFSNQSPRCRASRYDHFV